MPVSRIPEAEGSICRSDSIHRIKEANGKFLVCFSEHASWYRTDASALRESLRAAHDANCEVSFSCTPDCEIISVVVLPPLGFAQRMAEHLRETSERLFGAVTRRNTRWIRDAQRSARIKPRGTSQ
jgi:hypothetical protein